nr:unnamed protein product [Callosobruchus analis]
MSKRKTLDDVIIAEPKKSTPRETTKIEAHATTVTPEEIYSLPGTSSNPFPLTCNKYKLLKDHFVKDNGFSYPFSVHNKKQKTVICQKKHFDLFERFSYSKIYIEWGVLKTWCSRSFSFVWCANKMFTYDTYYIFFVFRKIKIG